MLWTFVRPARLQRPTMDACPLCLGPESFGTRPNVDVPFTDGGSQAAPLSRVERCAVLLPESFRGGCSFGVLLEEESLPPTKRRLAPLNVQCNFP